MIIQKSLKWKNVKHHLAFIYIEIPLIHSHFECVEDPFWYITPNNLQFVSEWIIINFILLKRALGKISLVIECLEWELISLSIILMPRFHQVEHSCCILVTQMKPHKFPSSTYSFIPLLFSSSKVICLNAVYSVLGVSGTNAPT